MTDFAIIGISGRFQDTMNASDLFTKLLMGKKLINKLNTLEEKKSNISNDSEFVPVYSEIPDAEYLDNNLFKMSTKESKITDPQQRIFLKCCYEAIEDAGYSTNNYTGNIGVFGSTEFSTYLLNNVLGSKYDTNDFNYLTFIGNEPDFLSTRVSYKLGLTGPSMSIQCGCSSSLASLSVACNYLELNKCDMALVGGVSLQYPQKQGYVYKKGSTFSKDGEVRPFDKNASGMVKGDGCGIILIKQLNKAIEDKDNIYCIIKGIGINNDGSRKVGYTAPSISGETEAIRYAIKDADIDVNPNYIETHGTGTPLGDPIELVALNKAYNFKDKQLVGSIKANIGHLDTAAGIVGVIKAALILKNKIIPKSINFERINSQAKNLPIKLETKNNIKLNDNKDHYVGVSSFGIGGTNVHLILKEYKKKIQEDENCTKDNYYIPISAETIYSLNGYEKKLERYLKTTEESIKDIAYTFSIGRNSYKYRRIYKVNGINDFREKLKKQNYYKCEDDSKYYNWIIGKDTIFPITKKKFEDARRVSLPTYYFDESKYEIKKNTINNIDRVRSNKTRITLTEMCETWSEVLDEDVTPDMDFFDELDGDSLLAVDLISEIENKFDLVLKNDILNQCRTPRKMVEKIISINSFKVNNIEMIKFDIENKYNLILIHPAGGTTYCFNKLSKYLKGFNVYTVSLPLSQKNKDIDSLASIYEEELKNKNLLDNSTILSGYSFGGNIAMKIAEQNANIKELWLIDTYLPEAYTTTELSNEEYSKIFPEIWLSMIGKLDSLTSGLKQELCDKKIEEIVSILKRENLIDSSISQNKIIELFNIWCNHHRALGKQTIDTINVNTVIFSAKNKMPQYMYKYAKMKEVPISLWKKYIKNTLKIIKIPGNHYSIMDNEENAKKLALVMNDLVYE